jgi:fructose-1,6-bisphosphatase I
VSTATLDDFLRVYAEGSDPVREAVARVVSKLAATAIDVRDSVNLGVLETAFAGTRDGAGAAGDVRKDLDVRCDEIFLDAMAGAPVALFASEDRENPVVLDRAAPLALAIDPIDGSSNIETNVSMGTIFSVLPVARPLEGTGLATFMQPGEAQLAAGFFMYGQQLALVLTLGAGTRLFVFSVRRGMFVEAYANLQIPQKSHEFSINASNYRHWDEPVRQYINDCLEGADGPHGRDYDMRWIASMVAEAYRILIRGGVYLYPTDSRKGYGKGGLRLIYEANPIAMVVEQAGGLATDTVTRILELKPTSLHQRVALVFGSSSDVARIERYHSDPARHGDRKPLFGIRGLFRT